MAARAKHSRGEIETLPSDSLRGRVYAGIDPVTRKRHHLTEIIPAGPRAVKEAEKARTRLLSKVDEQRNPRTRATVNQMLDRHLEMLAVEATTLDSYESFVRNHIRPLIGDVALGRINGEILDSFYRELARCRAHCKGRPFVQHRTDDAHDCDERCKPHVCRPLAAASLLKIQAILNSAGKRAVRWEWIGRNPFELSEPISLPQSDPRPPSAAQVVVIAGEAWRDLDWGMMVWLLHGGALLGLARNRSAGDRCTDGRTGDGEPWASGRRARSRPAHQLGLTARRAADIGADLRISAEFVRLSRPEPLRWAGDGGARSVAHLRREDDL